MNHVAGSSGEPRGNGELFGHILSYYRGSRLTRHARTAEMASRRHVRPQVIGKYLVHTGHGPLSVNLCSLGRVDLHWPMVGWSVYMRKIELQAAATETPQVDTL